MEKWGTYILLALLAVVLFVLLKMNKVMAVQTNLMVGMAGKLGVTVSSDNAEDEEKEHKVENKKELQSDDEEIVRIAQRLYTGKSLGKKDTEYYNSFKKEIDEEAGFFLADDMVRIAGEINSGNEITQEDATLYIKYLGEFQEKLSLPNITVPVKAKPFKEIKVLETMEDRKHLLLTYFDDGVPKTKGSLAKSYADDAGLVMSEGNTAKLLDKLLEEKKLMNQKRLHNNRNKVFYGLPHWFEGKKLSKEYSQKII